MKPFPLNDLFIRGMCWAAMTVVGHGPPRDGRRGLGGAGKPRKQIAVASGRAGVEGIPVLGK